MLRFYEPNILQWALVGGEVITDTHNDNDVVGECRQCSLVTSSSDARDFILTRLPF